MKQNGPRPTKGPNFRTMTSNTHASVKHCHLHGRITTALLFTRVILALAQSFCRPDFPIIKLYIEHTAKYVWSHYFSFWVSKTLV